MSSIAVNAGRSVVKRKLVMKRRMERKSKVFAYCV